MPFQEMKIKGAWIHTPNRHDDERGHFAEMLRISEIESELGRTFNVLQVNQSVSKIGVVRGIHYTAGSPGQAKYIFCPRGAIWDVVIDLRENSPTFGQWDAIEISSRNGLSVFISEGLGHAFLSLENDSVATYLTNAAYVEEFERAIYPLDPDLNIGFSRLAQKKGIDCSLSLSDRDRNAPSFKKNISPEPFQEHHP